MRGKARKKQKSKGMKINYDQDRSFSTEWAFPGAPAARWFRQQEVPHGW